jgi:hypothetical protein
MCRVNFMISVELTQSHHSHSDIHPTEWPSAGCLPQRIPKAAAGKCCKQLILLEHLIVPGIPWMPASVAHRCRNHGGGGLDCLPRAWSTSQHIYCTLVWWCFLLECKTVCTNLSLIFLMHSLHLPLNLCWLAALCAQNWITACWSWLGRCGMWWCYIFHTVTHHFIEQSHCCLWCS